MKMNKNSLEIIHFGNQILEIHFENTDRKIQQNTLILSIILVIIFPFIVVIVLHYFYLIYFILLSIPIIIANFSISNDHVVLKLTKICNKVEIIFNQVRKNNVGANFSLSMLKTIFLSTDSKTSYLHNSKKYKDFFLELVLINNEQFKIGPIFGITSELITNLNLALEKFVIENSLQISIFRK